MAFNYNPRPSNLSLSSIIVAEDDPFDAELTIRTLKSIPLYNPIVHLKDGEAVLDYLYCRGQYEGMDVPEPSLLILDIHMPKIDGIEILKHLKEDPAKQHIPVIMLTHSMEIKHVVESYGLGANSYVSKPVDLKQFEEAVQVLGMYWGLVNNQPKKAVKSPANVGLNS